MYRRNKKIACALALLMVVNNVSTSGILAYSKEKQTQTVAIKVVNDVNIVSTTTVTIEDAKRWAKKRNATQTFIGLADLFWKYAPSRGGVNPALAYVQSALETGYGRFGNVLDETYYNTCGLKRTETGTADDNNDKEAHKRFDNWDHGVQAHLDHLALYAGAPGFPKTKIEQNYLGNNLSSNATYDPRHFGYLAGKAKTATQLSNSWATSVEYGEKLVELYNSLLSEAESGRRGWLQDGDDWYYYNETGELHKGWLKLSDGTYYLNENGIVHKGWFQEGDNKYYFDNFGRAIIGRTETINGKSYTFDKEGKLVKENLKSGWHYEDYYWQYYKDGKRQHGWINIPNDGKYYVESYGMVKGWYDVEGKRYYFDDAGRAIVGKTIEIEGKEYTFDNEGVLVKALKSGWHYEDYYWQYYKDGKRQHGWINVPNDGKYYVESYGMVKGWYDVEGKRYYFDDAGRAIVGKTIEIEGKEYTFDNEGVLVKALKSGWHYEDYYWQYYKDGERQYGWINVPNDGKYYVESYGMVKGWHDVEGKRYYFDDAGRAIVGKTIEIEGKEYTFDNEGVLVKALKSGWHYEDYYWQYYKDGKRQHGWINVPNDGKYYVESYGMVKGWYDVEGKRYYFDDAGRAIVGKTIEIEGKEYTFNDEGVLVKSLKNGWHYEDYYWQYYKDGERQYGWINVPNDGKYYVEPYGMVKGWHDIEGKRYYFDDAGRAIAGRTENIEGKNYTFDENGVLQVKTGWCYEDYHWQYYNENGERHQGWLQKPEGKYYLADYGMVKGWFEEDGKRYNFDDAGIARKGWINMDGKNYYFYDDCHAAQFEFINGKYIGYDGYVKDKMTIVIDPGHNNGGDSGASCVHDGIVYDETQMNMDVAVKLRDALLAQGYNVIMTRQPGEIQTDKLSQSLLKRVVIANNEKADLFISIHHDSYNETSNGMTVFYDTYRPNVETNGVKTDSDGNDYDTTPCRAAIVSKEFTADLAKNLPSSLGLYNRGARYRNFYVTRNTIMPSMLIECGFISNPDEAKKLADPLHQLKMAGELTRNVNKLYKK